MSYPIVNPVQLGYAAAAEHPLVVQAGLPEQRLGLLPQRTFLAGRDGPVPRVRRPWERRYVERGGDALGDELLEQGAPEARPGEDPDAVVNLMGERARQRQL